MPPQLRALITLTLKWGAMPAIGVYLVWWITHSVDTKLEASQKQVDSLSQQLAQHNAAMTLEAAARAASEAETRRLLRGICYGTSADIPAAAAWCGINDPVKP